MTLDWNTAAWGREIIVDSTYIKPTVDTELSHYDLHHTKRMKATCYQNADSLFFSVSRVIRALCSSSCFLFLFQPVASLLRPSCALLIKICFSLWCRAVSYPVEYFLLLLQGFAVSICFYSDRISGFAFTELAASTWATRFSVVIWINWTHVIRYFIWRNTAWSFLRKESGSCWVLGGTLSRGDWTLWSIQLEEFVQLEAQMVLPVVRMDLTVWIGC